MLRGYLLVLVLGVLLSPRPAEASWWRRNWPAIARVAATVLPAVLAGGRRDVAAMDSNRDGVLDERELAQHIGDREALDFLLTVGDADGDGQLTRREMEHFLREVERRVR